ncbi:hypothetical protein CspeluHIS016_0111750 [Cutaneotrichosporon spelunceum]|uniref:DUF1308 domain-containing protein n=1 Tax=Cutaneotrichosporon spelunceum TaxID=1672016 RepID=A0AAD3TQ57_9TREE|nr:hypothetical protein CspeluHIS016_0111750 [Cutaneotrichosporon spelunceum]
MAEGSPLAAVGTQLRTLATEIQRYLSNVPEGDLYFPPVIGGAHADDYVQKGVQGLSKFLHHVQKESAIVDALLESHSPPVEYSTNLVSLQGVWDAFKRAPRPLVGVWQTMERQNGPGSVKVDVVAAGGNEWVKVNTIKESRLMVEFREHDSYINSDYDSDSDAEGVPSPGAELTNSLITQARALVDAAQQYQRLPGLPQPRIRYVLTRLEGHPESGHPDPRIPQSFAALRDLGIELEFATQWTAPPPPLTRPAEAVPATDIVLDLSVLIALCCDSTHYPLPQDENELEARFRLLRVGEAPATNAAHKPVPHLAPHSNATRDLRDQLQLEMTRPLIQELSDRLSAGGITTPRFWCTREVHGRLPGLVEVIGGAAERRRAKALFDPTVGDFWEGSRWEGAAGHLTSIHVTIIEDGELLTHEPETAFDAAVAAVCERMIAASGASTPPSREPTPGPTKPVRPQKKKEKEKAEPKTKTKKDRDGGQASKNPLRPGTVFPASSRLPSGHTLRTLLAGILARATVLTNNRGAVLKVMREAGVTDGIPDTDGDARRARIWVVNSSSLAEWRRIEVEENNRRVLAGETGGEVGRKGHGDQS